MTPTDSAKRDVELVLLGLAISSSERDKVLLLPSGAFSKEFVPVIDGIRNKSGNELFRWLSLRGVKQQDGMTAIDLMINRITDLNKRRIVRDILGTLEMGSRMDETSDDLLHRVKLALQQIEKIT